MYLDNFGTWSLNIGHMMDLCGVEQLHVQLKP